MYGESDNSRNSHQQLPRTVMPSLPLMQGKPLDVPRTVHQALELHRQGRIAEAERLYSAVLAVRPDNIDSLQMLGDIKLARGELASALRLFSAAMQLRPKSPQILVGYGLALNGLGQHGEALAAFDQAIKHKKGFAEAHNNRGGVLVALNRDAEALESFERAAAARPDYAEAHYNRGFALHRLGRNGEALQSLERAIALRPGYAKAHVNRGVVLDALGRAADALESYDRALAIQADLPDALLNRAAALHARKRYDEALGSLDRLLAAHPDNADGHYLRGRVMVELNRPDEAVACCETAVTLNPEFSRARWTTPLFTLPILYGDEAEIAVRRADYERRLRALGADFEAGRIPGDMTKGLGWAQPFFLAYQGHCDRELQIVFGALASRVMAARYGQTDLATPPAQGERIRVGIVSGFFFQHSVWKIGCKAWVTQLDRQRFEVYGYSTGFRKDAETELARQRCDRFTEGPRSLAEWREIISADRPHVLLYPEIGMFHQVAEIAALRLAPVQCSYIGHPQTSGYPTVDYFLSGELIEPAEGDAHYSEVLVRLPNIGFHYEPPEIPPATVTREELGLRASATAYWCPQSLFKYLPQHDAVFPRIAQAAGDCQFVFIRHSGAPAVTELFQARLDRVFAKAGLKASDHCVFLSGMELPRFAAASRVCDVMLDSIEWSGGNTTLEALAQDLPVVTVETALMRGRVSGGMLRMMGMPETIASNVDGYVALAVRLAREPELRAALKARVARERHRLYRDRASIAALENFIERAVRR
jgi:predicted O-linked N-acetylglucosamine transferase (SPINDLY family)